MHVGRKCQPNAALDVLEPRLKLEQAMETIYNSKNCSWSSLRKRRGSVGEEVLQDLKRDWGEAAEV